MEQKTAMGPHENFDYLRKCANSADFRHFDDPAAGDKILNRMNQSTSHLG
ncbi:MAG: hypothetical protein ACHP8A_10315 [Terriglobales bacterium]|nr:hypothetical protein [Terriglobales bacterium]